VFLDEANFDMAITIETRNYRALRRTNWTPSGVCVVVGPNGAGKTTLLTLFEFLRNAYLRSAPSAIDHLGGVYGLRSWGSSAEESVLVALTVGDLRWELQLTAQGPTLSEQLGEQVMRGQESVLSRAALSQRLFYRGDEREIADREERLGLRIVFDAAHPEELGPLVRALTNNRIYRSYNLWGLQTNGSRQSGDLYLHPNGQNVFAVLRNWRDRRDFKPQYEFVVSGLRVAFPDLFQDLDFHVAGMTITVDLIEPVLNQSCPLALAPDGWITALLHLTAVAGAAEGSFVAIDDFGNDLHPYAIRGLTAVFREWSEERGLTVCLASHSPVLLDEFKEHPGSVFVMERGLENRPVPLTELYEQDWLARFSLGRLYEHGEFGGQQKGVGAMRRPAHRAE
jgi:predicted ATPase